MKTCLRFFAPVVVLSSVFCPLSSLFAQGSLTPPGAPAPTMKTLDQVEARKIVNGTNTPGDGSNLFIINTPGAYYLTANITGISPTNGIQINADNVTLDLNGFALIGVTGAPNGIVVSGAHHNVRIYNGNLQSWPTAGIDATTATNSQFDHLNISGGGGGLKCGAGNLVADVTVESSGGISVGDGSTVRDCIARNNNNGITTTNNCTITACAVSGGTGNGFSLGSSCTIIGCTSTSNRFHGIVTGDNCTVRDCTSSLSQRQNGIIVGVQCLVVSCTSTSNGSAGFPGDGIRSAGHSTIERCVAAGNTLRGIEAQGECIVLENHCYNNGGDGILATNGLNRIDSNHVNNNSGVGINAGNDWVVRNSTGANGGGGVVGAGADIGPSEPAQTATHPFANMP